jgi:hypothetical protein
MSDDRVLFAVTSLTMRSTVTEYFIVLSYWSGRESRRTRQRHAAELDAEMRTSADSRCRCNAYSSSSSDGSGGVGGDEDVCYLHKQRCICDDFENDRRDVTVVVVVQASATTSRDSKIITRGKNIILELEIYSTWLFGCRQREPC